MRRAHVLSPVLFVAALGTAGCSSNNKGKIEGTKWSSIAQNAKAGPLPAGAISLEFTKDNKLSMRAGLETYTGAYTLGSGDTVTFNLDRELSKQKTLAEKLKIEGDKLTWTDSDGTVVVFERAKEGAIPSVPGMPPGVPGGPGMK